MLPATYIVCIDDDQLVLANLARDIPTALPQCHVITAPSRKDALEHILALKAAKAEIPVILCSHIVAKENGHSVIEAIRPHLPDGLYILLTDPRLAPPVERYAPIFRAISKPWLLEDLMFTISGAMESYQQQKRLEHQASQIQSRHEHLQTFITRLPDGTLTVDVNGIIQSVNPATSRIFGYSEEEMVGQAVEMLMFPADAIMHNRYLQSYRTAGQAQLLNITREVQGRRADGGSIPLEITVFDFVDGEQPYFSAILRDLSERKRAERLAHEKALAEQQAAAKSSFLATMSHEIRTPMNGVLGTLELLEATGLSSEQAALVGICQDSAHYLLTIIDDILDFSKIDAGKLQFELLPTRLDDVVFSVAELLSSRAWSKDLELVTFVDNALPGEVVCDQARIRQILINLVGNAIKFTHQGQVSVRVRPLEDSATPGEPCRIRFEVTDTGIGLTEEQISRLFRPFEQAEAGTTRRFGGTGLGLAISRRLVEMMDGKIGVTANHGEGATFWFEVPLLVKAPPQPRLRLRAVRILLVAANPIFRDAMERGLSAAGARVETTERFAYAPQMVAEAAAHDPYALVVVEDGCAATHGAYSGDAKLQDPRLGTIPVLLMARRDRGPIAKVIKMSGAHLGLSRPARPGLLIQTVAVAIGQEPASILDRDGHSALADEHERNEAALRFSGGRVLVAEDTPTSRLVVTKMLQRMGIDPVVAEDGAKAWAILQQQSFDLLITDGHMPEMDGFQLTEAIRAQEEDGISFCLTPGIALPIVALSAGVLDEEKARCHAVGMDGFLAKPVESRTLRKALLAFLPPDYHPSDTAESATAQSQPASPPPPVTRGQVAARCGQPISVTVPTEAPAPPPAAVRPEVQALADGSVLNLDIYRELFGDITDDVHALLHDFLTSAESLSQEITTLEQAQDGTSLARSAHRLAGAALTAGATDLGTLCRALETAVKTGAPWTEVSEYATQIPQSLADVRHAVLAIQATGGRE